MSMMTTDFAANDALIAMESQLRQRSNDVVVLQEELEAARRQIALLESEGKGQGIAPLQDRKLDVMNKGVGSGSSNSTVAATLMAQIQFLHGEVERLEKELRKVRSDSAAASRAIHADHARVLTEKVAEVEALTQENELLRNRIGPLERKVGKLGNGEDLMTRCRMLENQLSTALAERQAAMIDMHNSAVKVRKLEAALRGTKESVVALETTANAEAEAVDSQVRSLHQVIAALTDDRDSLRKEVDSLRRTVNVKRHNVELQTSSVEMVDQATTPLEVRPEYFNAGCQVDSIKHYADTVGDSVQVVAHHLEQKCHELDSARASLDELAVAHTETLQFLELTKKRLSEELQQRKMLDDENEKLLIQVRALQQQNSQLNALCREQVLAVERAEQQMQQAVNASLRVEEERRQWEADMQVQQRDMQQLVAGQNLANQQMAQQAAENDALREECQKLLQREAQCSFTLKAKDAEMQELIQCYQSAVREAEKHAHSVNSLNRETDNLRAAVASREDRIAALMDQVNQLHHREQQLAVDLQSVDYEGGVLHRKLLTAETELGKYQSQIHDLTNQLTAAQRVNFEFERNNAELQKQLVIKDNAAMLARARCDEVEHHYTILNTQFQAEHQRLIELEDAHARMVVRGILASQQGTGSGTTGRSTADSSAAYDADATAAPASVRSSPGQGYAATASAATPPRAPVFPHTRQ